MGLVAPLHVRSSQSRAQTCVPCIGRRILNHCTTREARKHLTSKEQSPLDLAPPGGDLAAIYLPWMWQWGDWLFFIETFYSFPCFWQYISYPLSVIPDISRTWVSLRIFWKASVTFPFSLLDYGFHYSASLLTISSSIFYLLGNLEISYWLMAFLLLTFVIVGLYLFIPIL